MTEARVTAAREALFCESVLAKSGENVVLVTLAGARPETWAHYPPGDVSDPDTGAQWFYHSHPPGEGNAEHGHFHCFVRPEGPKGPIHHLVAVGVDPYGRLLRLFTVNQWVVGDVWLPAAPTIALIERFDVHMNKPSYLVNRWLSAVLRLYADDIAELVQARDARLAAHPDAGTAREDRDLEVTSERKLALDETARALGVV